MFGKFSYLFEGPDGSKDSALKGAKQGPCVQEGCGEKGLYRAPKSRYHLERGLVDWHWFCLVHVREYNARWNYYTNMSEAEIEQERRSDITWQRPSWTSGKTSQRGDFKEKPRSSFNQAFEDPFDLFPNDFEFSSPSCHVISPQSSQGKALQVMGMCFPFTQQELQKRYRELVKKHHPDTNGGSLEAEEILRDIIEAHGVLKTLLYV